jgi:hypothetical protein
MAPWRDFYHNIYINHTASGTFSLHTLQLRATMATFRLRCPFYSIFSTRIYHIQKLAGRVLGVSAAQQESESYVQRSQIVTSMVFFSASQLPGSPNAGKLKNRTFLSSINIWFHIFSGLLLSNSSSRYSATPSIAHASTPLAFARMIKYFARTLHPRRHKPSH